MNNTKIIYETGATSHAVNDLILFTDNTPQLAKLRDGIYKEWSDKKSHPIAQNFIPLLDAAQLRYYQEFKNKEDHHHIYGMDKDQNKEYCSLYAQYFDNWKLDHGYK